MLALCEGENYLCVRLSVSGHARFDPDRGLEMVYFVLRESQIGLPGRALYGVRCCCCL